MHITHGGWEGSHTCTLGFENGAITRQLIYRYQLLHSTPTVCFFRGGGGGHPQLLLSSFPKLCCGTSILNKMCGNSLSDFRAILNNLFLSFNGVLEKCSKHKSIF